jgi:hypothetical protein
MVLQAMIPSLASKMAGSGATMTGEHGRYFIELQPKAGDPVTRNRETELRREQAAHYIVAVGEWLRREALENKVASMAITALGQVQIICEADIINHLRHEDEETIVAIRHGAMFVETMNRWTDAR